VDLLERLQTALAGRYRIEREVGRGGMATVYLAEDLKHGRRVALKVLRPELSSSLGAERFQREIATASRLQHPHILALHDSGEAAGLLYYAMPYVEGESLRSRLTREVQLDATVAVGIAAAVADALTCAHAAGVLHRDIKPENILLTGGHAVVADFGIARALDAVGADRLTETGLALGTPHYMSPEQAAGARVLDARSDVYALGCVVYEMLAGEPPFNGPTSQAILARHALDPVPCLRTVRSTISPALESTVGKALAKVPADRFATALEFKEALTRASREPAITRRTPAWRRPAAIVAVGAAVAGVTAGLLGGLGSGRAAIEDGERPIRSLAVAPLLNLTGDSAQVYLAQGITDQLVTTLAQIGALRVVGLRGSGAGMSPEDLARALEVDAVLGGSLQRAGETVRIRVQLSSAASGRALWAHSYDGELRTILGLQDEVARSVADRIRVSMTPEERSRLSAARPSISPAAYQAYVRGWHFLERVSEANFRRAIGYFQQAIEADPAYAAAYVGLALSYDELGYYALAPATEAYPQARAAARKALELDSTLGEAHAALAEVDQFHTWDFPAAQRGYERALALSPRYARGHMALGMHLTAMGRVDEAVAALKRAQELEPLSILTLAAAARPYYNGRRYVEAIAQARRALEIDSTFSRAHYWVGMSFAQMGRPREAIREFDETLRQAGPTPVYLAASAYAYALAGDRSRAESILRELVSEARSKPVSPVEIAAIYAGLGQDEQCFEWLAKGFERRDPLMTFVAVDPRFDRYRGAPRFQDLLRRMGFPAALIAPPPTGQ
jgi:TolB-like protein/Flp pilus assembly protein TadD/tRNA A-37 threonylcarbamoyl transferase component Bud32